MGVGSQQGLVQQHQSCCARPRSSAVVVQRWRRRKMMNHRTKSAMVPMQQHVTMTNTLVCLEEGPGKARGVFSSCPSCTGVAAHRAPGEWPEGLREQWKRAQEQRPPQPARRRAGFPQQKLFSHKFFLPFGSSCHSTSKHSKNVNKLLLGKGRVGRGTLKIVIPFNQ